MAKKKKPTRDDLNVGDAFAFPSDDDRWVAVRVLAVNHTLGQHVLAGITAWSGSGPPTLDDPRLCLLMRLTAEGGSGEPFTFWVRDHPLPDGLTRLGVIPPTLEETGLVETGNMEWPNVISTALAQLKWDEEQGIPPADDEHELRRRENVAALRHAAERRAKSLADLTSGHHFQSDEWTDDEEGQMLRRFRRYLKEAVESLMRLGDSGDDLAKLDVLQTFVQRINNDMEFVDTIEAEHIADAFDELVYLAGLEDYGQSLFDPPWRDY